jgi:hypothetical protein
VSWFLWSALAKAAPFVTSVGAEQATGLGGGWARAFPDDAGWSLLWSAGGDFQRLPMAADLSVVDRDRTALTGRSDLVDHAIALCPDGTYLHAASASVDSPNDSAYAFRQAADFALTASATVEERSPGRPHNDMAVLCSPVGDGVAFGSMNGGHVDFFPLGDEATPGTPVTLEGAPTMSGGSLYYEASSDTILVINFDFAGELQIARYDTELRRIETITRDVVSAPLRGYWAQALLRVGDVYVLGHMARDDSAGFELDEGDVYLSFFDLDWNLLEQDRISRNVPPLGGMRPALARKGDQLLVLYDKDVQPMIFDVRLDLEALGVDTGVDSGGTGADSGGTGADSGGTAADSGGIDTDSGGPSDSGGAPETTVPKGDGHAASDGCGCDSGAARAREGIVMLVLFALRRRRPPVPPTPHLPGHP